MCEMLAFDKASWGAPCLIHTAGPVRGGSGSRPVEVNPPHEEAKTADPRDCTLPDPIQKSNPRNQFSDKICEGTYGGILLSLTVP